MPGDRFIVLGFNFKPEIKWTILYYGDSLTDAMVVYEQHGKPSYSLVRMIDTNVLVQKY